MGTFKYCPLCGNELTGHYVQGKSYPKCPTGHYTYFPSQTVGAAAIICHEERILLERRAIEPGYGLWALPGGMAEPGEAMEECVVREVVEETGLHVQVTKLLDVIGGNRVCIIFYEASLVEGELRKSEESFELQWFPFAEIPYDDMAFPRHKEVLQIWINTNMR